MKNQSPKDIIRSLYSRDLLNDRTILKDFFNDNISLMWNSSDGLTIMNLENLREFFEGMRASYTELRIEISHLLAQRNFVIVRHKYYVRTFENPEEELGIAHFMVIWEINDGKIIRGHMISQPASSKDDTSKGYETIKV